MLGVSALRNQNLANIFYRLRLIEAYGTGILKINESYSDSSIKPSIEATSNAFKIILPNLNYAKENGSKTEETKRSLTSSSKKEERIEAVVSLCRKNGFVIRKDIEQTLHVSQATAILLLREMVADGLLTKKGSAKTLRYYLTDF